MAGRSPQTPHCPSGKLRFPHSSPRRLQRPGHDYGARSLALGGGSEVAQPQDGCLASRSQSRRLLGRREDFKSVGIRSARRRSRRQIGSKCYSKPFQRTQLQDRVPCSVVIRQSDHINSLSLLSRSTTNRVHLDQDNRHTPVLDHCPTPTSTSLQASRCSSPLSLRPGPRQPENAVSFTRPIGE